MITICGIGPGNPDLLLPAARKAVEKSDVLMGGERHLCLFNYLNIPIVKINGHITDLMIKLWEFEGQNVTILVSGDTGFHSLLGSINRQYPELEVTVIPGISTYQYFFAQLQMTYEDAYITSLHGQEINFISKLSDYKKIFLLTDSQHSWKYISQLLCDNGYGDCVMHVGNNLSYPDQQIVSANASEFLKQEYDFNFCAVILENKKAINNQESARNSSNLGIADTEFIRGNIPMTKEEIRVLALSKLQLKSNDHLLDIGAGTGSVSIEAALQLKLGKVTAIERKEEAIELIKLNAQKFNVNNIEIKHGEAPEMLSNCIGVTKVFIGGSGGELTAIIDWTKKNTSPETIIVITAVTLNTLELARKCLDNSDFEQPEIIQVAVTRVERIGKTDMMRANTPIWIIKSKTIKE